MSSKRHLRRRGCDGKQRHATQRGAVAHLLSLRADGPAHAYRCPHCRGWHVGHTPASVLRAIAGRRGEL